MYKYYIEMTGQPVRSMTFDRNWKGMKGLVEKENLDFVAATLCTYSFVKSIKEVLSLQGAWHSPIRLPKMVNDPVFCIITFQIVHWFLNIYTL